MARISRIVLHTILELFGTLTVTVFLAETLAELAWDLGKIFGRDFTIYKQHWGDQEIFL